MFWPVIGRIPKIRKSLLSTFKKITRRIGSSLSVALFFRAQRFTEMLLLSRSLDFESRDSFISLLSYVIICKELLEIH